MAMRKNQRRYLNLQVERRLQIWLMIRMGGIIILTAIISALILYGYARHETINSFYDAHIKIRRLSDLLIPVVLSGCAVSLVGGVIVAIFLPQKLAGPIYRINKDFEAVRNGDLTVRINLRNNDTLTSFAEQLNATIQHIDQQFGQIQKLNDNQKSLSKVPGSDVMSTSNQLDELLSSIKTTHSSK